MNSVLDKNIYKISQSRNGAVAKQNTKSKRDPSFNEESMRSSDSDEKNNKQVNKRQKKHVSRQRSRSNSSRISNDQKSEVYRL
jgi:hypothetical protein